MSEYSDKFKDPLWQKFRLEVYGHYDFTCYYCKAKDKTLHAHHHQYLKGRQPWDYPMDYMMCLCEDCHEKRHELIHDLIMALRKMDNLTIHKAIEFSQYIDAESITGFAFVWKGISELLNTHFKAGMESQADADRKN